MKRRPEYLRLKQLVADGDYTSTQLANATPDQIKRALRRKFDSTIDKYFDRDGENVTTRPMIKNALSMIVSELKAEEESMILKSIRSKLTKQELAYIRTFSEQDRLPDEDPPVEVNP